MAQTLIEYISDGIQTAFAVPFQFIDRAYVNAYRQAYDSHGRRAGDLVLLDFGWNHAGLIQIDAPIPAGDRILIARETYADQSLVDFQDAAILTEEDLDLAAKQSLHVAQEARERTGYELRSVATDVFASVTEVDERLSAEVVRLDKGKAGKKCLANAVKALEGADAALSRRLDEAADIGLQKPHASRHALGGADPLTPAAIGALTPPPANGSAYLATGSGWLEFARAGEGGAGAAAVLRTFYLTADGEQCRFQLVHGLNSRNLAIHTQAVDSGEVIHFAVTVNDQHSLTLATAEPLPADTLIRVILLGPGGKEDGEGGRKEFIHQQNTPAEVWDITHSLGTRYPALSLVDETGDLMVGKPDFAASTPNYLRIAFALPTAGTAILSL